MSHAIVSPKKLIEVALPLDAINAAASAEKNNPFLRGHPRSMHTWWARQPFTGARAILFGQLVNDPEDLWRCQNPGKEPNQQVKGHWTKARARLFGVIEELVLWENTTNEIVLEKAREEIRKSWRETCELNKQHPQANELFNPDKMPGLHDPFAGGGAIPLEAQRLGLEAYASDLNPVAVLINKAMIEIPPKFVSKPPVRPDTASRRKGTPRLALDETWKGAAGLAEDVRHYGKWMRDEAEKRIGHLYPQIEITKAMAEGRPDLKPLVNQKLNVIACLWARTVKSPNPAFSHVDVPLATTFILSSKDGKEAYVHPVIDKGAYHFTVKVGKPRAESKAGTKAARGSFRCLLSDSPIESEYLRQQGMAGKIGQKLMAIVAEGVRGRVYLSPTPEQEKAAYVGKPTWRPDVEFFQDALGFRVGNYGMTKWSDIFTDRQLVALATLCDLVSEVRDVIRRDAVAAGVPDDNTPLNAQGNGAYAYSEAVSVYLGMATSRWADFCNTICSWNEQNQNIRVLFARQAIPMSWDFAELSPFSAVGPWFGVVESISDALPRTASECRIGTAIQASATNQALSRHRYVSTDPPYYDNIGYADLSDFFYVWLRRSLRSVFPDLLATIAVPKSEELVATPARHGGKTKAEEFFLGGMTQAIHNLAIHAHPSAPVTIYYAFKQSETESEGTNSSGWETFLEAIFRSNYSLTGTWPMRTNKQGRTRANNSNALASAVILVCRPRATGVGSISRRQFVRLLNEALPIALDAMTRESEGLHSPVAPVDLSQAIIGPGMAIFSRYEAVLEADGSPMSVKTALQLINRFLAEDDFDSDTQFCLHWFEQHKWDTGKFGEADTLARAKGTSVDGVRQSGVIQAGAGNVRLLKWAEYPTDWNANDDRRLNVWEALHQLIRAFNEGGESGAGAVLSAIQSKAEAARQLAYRLYTLCERAGLSEEARAYNDLVTSWAPIESAASHEANSQQRTLFE